MKRSIGTKVRKQSNNAKRTSSPPKFVTPKVKKPTSYLDRCIRESGIRRWL